MPDDGLVELSFMEALFVDRAMPMRRLFFYEGPGVPPFPSLARSLRSSLAAALAVFPPLSGKFAHRPSATAGDAVVVDCSPDAVSPGVRFVEAEYDGGIADMRRVASGSDEGDTEALMEIGPELDARQLPAPVLAVQVTRPAAGGRAVVVGVAVHHSVADGHSAWQFVRAWAALARMEGSPSQAVSDLAPPAFDRAPLRYLAVSSLIWTSIARAKSGDDLAGDGDAYFLVAVDFRRRLGPPIGDRYFGDCVARASSVDSGGGGAGLASAAAAIRDAIRAQPACPVRAMEAWLEALRAVVPRAKRFTFTGSSNRFMAYETDFGWGAPSKVELVSLFATELVLLLGAAHGGVQVTATLWPEHMEAFASNLARFSGRGDEA